MPVRYGLSGSPVWLLNTRSRIPSLAHRVKCLSEIVPSRERRSAAPTTWHSQRNGCPCLRVQPIGSERCYERIGSGKSAERPLVHSRIARLWLKELPYIIVLVLTSDLNFKFFDQQIPAEKCAFRRHARGAFGVEFRALTGHEAAQRFDVIGKRGSVVWHAKLVS
jgi:hypothetical protein